MKFDSETKKFIMDIYKNNETDIRGLYTVLNIFEKEKKRYEIREEYRQAILRELQGIDDITYGGNYNSNDSKEITLLIHFKEKAPSLGLGDTWLVRYSNGKFETISSVQPSKASHQLFFDMNEQAIIDFCEFGLRNDFNIHPMLVSYSKKFNILALDKSFDVNFVGKENSCFRLRYNYENGIECYTNILGLKHVFKKDDEVMRQIFKHIKLDDKDVPNYLKQGKQKIYIK